MQHKSSCKPLRVHRQQACQAVHAGRKTKFWMRVQVSRLGSGGACLVQSEGRVQVDKAAQRCPAARGDKLQERAPVARLKALHHLR